MRIFGLEIIRTKAAPQALNSVDTNRGWFPIVREPFSGAWQRNEELSLETAFANPAMFRCISLIKSDIAKMPIRLVKQTADGIWEPAESPAFSPVLSKPNHFQNRIQFFEDWVNSKLTAGNTLVLKERDQRGVVVSHYVLDWRRCKPLVAPNGEVFYELSGDSLAGLPNSSITVPASEVMHDRWNCLFHPLVGLSPIYACGLAALQGLEIQRNATKFFRNGSRPGGVLTAPGAISDEIAKRLKDHWDNNYTGENAGKVAVLGDGLRYEAMAMKAVDAQLIEQLKWSAETVCGVFGVPGYMAGVGAAPLNNNVEALAQQYYSQCLQALIEAIELCLDEGLGLTTKKDGVLYGTEFDLDALLRMDTASLVKTLSEGMKGILAPNEARQKLNLKPVPGGDAPYMQEQNWPLAMLEGRELPTREPTPPAPIVPPELPDSVDENADKSYDYSALKRDLGDGEKVLHVLRGREACERLLQGKAA